jgi:hypothetical protein
MKRKMKPLRLICRIQNRMKPKRKAYLRKRIKVLHKMSVLKVHRENMMAHRRVHPVQVQLLELVLPPIRRVPTNRAPVQVGLTKRAQARVKGARVELTNRVQAQVELTKRVQPQLHRTEPELMIPTIKAWI